MCTDYRLGFQIVAFTLEIVQYNIRLLEAVRTHRRTIIEREKYVENENVKMVHNEQARSGPVASMCLCVSGFLEID